jgi:hypothetical protein
MLRTYFTWADFAALTGPLSPLLLACCCSSPHHTKPSPFRRRLPASEARSRRALLFLHNPGASHALPRRPRCTASPTPSAAARPISYPSPPSRRNVECDEPSASKHMSCGFWVEVSGGLRCCFRCAKRFCGFAHSFSTSQGIGRAREWVDAKRGVGSSQTQCAVNLIKHDWCVV